MLVKEKSEREKTQMLVTSVRDLDFNLRLHVYIKKMKNSLLKEKN